MIVKMEKPVRLLQIHNRYRLHGGEDVSVQTEFSLLNRMGIDAHQFITDNPQSPFETLGKLLLTPYNIFSRRDIKQILVELRPDVIHIHNTWFALSPSIIDAAWKLDIPVIMSLRNYRLACSNALLYRNDRVCTECVGRTTWRSVPYGCYKDSTAASLIAATTIELNRLLGTWTRKVDRLIALTEFQRQLMIKAGYPEDRLCVKPNLVPDPGPRPQPPSASNTVLYAGRLAVEKGLDLLMKSWESADTGDLELVLAGDGPLLQGLKSKAPDSVRVLGHQSPDSVRQLMLCARAGVFPTRWFETFGLSAVEQLAAGAAVLVPSHYVLAREFHTEVGPEWVVSEDDLWVDAINRLKQQDVDRAGSRARDMFESRFSPEASSKTYTQIIAEVTSS